MAVRRTLDETRTLLLDVGIRMLIETGVEVNAKRINLIDVCREAGLKTSGSGYKIWPSQDEFRTDLLRHLADSTIVDGIMAEAIFEAIEPQSEQPDFVQMVHSAADISAKANFDGDSYVLYSALWLAALQDPEVAESVRASDDATLNSYAEVYDATVDAYGREWVPPFTAQHLSTTLSSLVQGFAQTVRVQPERVPDDLLLPTGPGGSDEPWNLFACGVKAVVEAFTRPKEPRTPS